MLKRVNTGAVISFVGNVITNPEDATSNLGPDGGELSSYISIIVVKVGAS
jgi:hypothetical protein